MSDSAATIGTRVRHELVRFWMIALYLYICFGAILLYKAAILHAQGIAYWPYGTAAIQALLLAKFLLIGEAFGLGGSHRPRRMIVALLIQAVIFLLFLMLLSAAEEVVTGLIHGRSVMMTLDHLWGGTLLQVFATSFLMLLILIPYLAVREAARMVGPERLRAILLERSSA